MKKLERQEMKNLKGGNPVGGGSEYCCMLYCYEGYGATFLGKVSIGNTCGTSPYTVCQEFYPTTDSLSCACGQQNW